MLELFAGELRRLRMAAGLSQEALGERISYSASLVAAVEQCRRLPQNEFAEECDSALGAGGLLLRIRESIMRESLTPWFREWVAIEQKATALRSFEPLVVPGLLQTEDYVRALLEGASQLSGDAREQLVTSRLARQPILEGTSPPLMVAVMDEVVLERPVGSPKVMRAQLLHLVDVASRPRVHLHVVPKAAGAYPGLNGAFVIATSPEGDDLGYLDNQLKGTVVERSADVLSLRQTWESVRAEALTQGQSTKLISEAAAAWT
ncbi:helix-turn-helix domain-containing protein [Pseudosporangium ferrugineum]|nr:helix-turn-helix transcriptional regulator [Pseudosporangium ferrugineum]